jgi:dephospho-CoA kinase
MAHDAKLRVGLTGGIGSGKSTVAALLAKRGATIIDTDAIARQLSQPGGGAVAAIRKAFGRKFIDAAGGLDRSRMRELVFSNAQARERLQAILHPLIGAEADQQALTSASELLVFDVPLLAESGRWRSRVDRVLVIDCSETTQVERVVARSGWSVDAVRAVIAQQATRAQRRSCADAVIFNDGMSTHELGLQVQALWEAWGRQ